MLKTLKKALHYSIRKFKRIVANNLLRFKYIRLYRSTIKNFFYEYNLKNVKTFKYVFFQNEEGNGYRFFLKGIYNKEKVFIKLGFNDVLMSNEIKVFKTIMGSKVDNIIFPRVLDEKNSKDGTKISLIILPFVKYRKIGFINNESTFKAICSSGVEMLDKLFEINLIHGDLVPNNIFVDNNKIVIFDFDDSFCSRMDSNIDYSLHGTNKKYDNGNYILDDAYSLSQTIKSCVVNKNYLGLKEYEEIVKRIGRMILVYNGKKTEIIKL